MLEEMSLTFTTNSSGFRGHCSGIKILDSDGLDEFTVCHQINTNKV